MQNMNIGVMVDAKPYSLFLKKMACYHLMKFCQKEIRNEIYNELAEGAYGDVPCYSVLRLDSMKETGD